MSGAAKIHQLGRSRCIYGRRLPKWLNVQEWGPFSRALRLDYSKLKNLTLKGPSQCPVPATTFVELLPLASHALGDCSIEVESPRGARLRIQIQNATSSGVASLIRELVA